MVNGTANRGGCWISWAGLVYVAAWVAGLILAPSGPAATAAASELRTYYLAHREVAMLQTYLFDGLAGAALLVFAASLRSAFRRPDGESAALSDVLFGASVAAAGVSFVQGAFGEVLANHGTAGTNLDELKLLFDLLNAADTFKLLALSLFIGATSFLTFRTRALPLWLGWVGAALAVSLIAGGLSFVLGSAGLYTVLVVALPLLLLWVAAISVVNLRRAGRSSMKAVLGCTRSTSTWSVAATPSGPAIGRRR